MTQDIKQLAEVTAIDFARFLEEQTKVIYEDKITLYRYDGSEGVGNYTLDDIYTVYKEKYGADSAAPSQSVEVYVPVSVEDELPEDVGNERLLVKTDKNGWFECYWDDSYGFYDNEPDEELDWDGITHWLKKTTLPIKDSKEVKWEALKQKFIDILYEANGTGAGAEDIVEYLKENPRDAGNASNNQNNQL